eukprot:7380688-Prymnesium_polylepis.1
MASSGSIQPRLATGASSTELRAAGFSSADLKREGFRAGAVLAGGYSVEELRLAGYSTLEINTAVRELQQASAQKQRDTLKMVTHEAISRTEERMASWAEEQIHVAVSAAEAALRTECQQVVEASQQVATQAVEKTHDELRRCQQELRA